MAIKYFSTPTCGPCKMFKPIVKEVAAELGVSIEYIDASIDSVSAQQYVVTAVPTMIITDSNFQPVKRHTGVMSRQQLKEFINK
jgi:thiol-disulfide isomerase/thioredoxin